MSSIKNEKPKEATLDFQYGVWRERLLQRGDVSSYSEGAARGRAADPEIAGGWAPRATLVAICRRFRARVPREIRG